MILNYLAGPKGVTRILTRGRQEGPVQRMRCDSGNKDERRERFEDVTLLALKRRKGPEPRSASEL